MPRPEGGGKEKNKMRPAAIILLVIFLAAVGMTGYIYFTANVIVNDIQCIAADAVNAPEVFQGLKSQAEKGTFTGTPFQTDQIGEAADYQFYTYTVYLQNRTFLKAEVAEVQVTPMNGDVLQMAEDSRISIPARGKGSVQATILTKKDMHNVRELMITYYLWGLPFSIRVTYSG